MTSLSLITALSLMNPLVVGSSASSAFIEAAGSPTAARQISLRIESKALLDVQVADAAEQTVFFVRSDSVKALDQTHGVDVVHDPAAPAIVVHLSWVDYTESIYGVRVEAVRPGTPALVVESFECECADSELTAAVIARLPAALEKLEGPEPAAAEPPERRPAEPVVETSSDPVDDAPRKPLGTLGRAGLGLGLAGVATLVGGGIVLAQGRKPDGPPGLAQQRTGLNFKPPGIAMMVSGGAALVTGAVLLIVDRRKASRSTSALVLPSPGGLVLTGRF